MEHCTNVFHQRHALHRCSNVLMKYANVSVEYTGQLHRYSICDECFAQVLLRGCVRRTHGTGVASIPCAFHSSCIRWIYCSGTAPPTSQRTVCIPMSVLNWCRTWGISGTYFTGDASDGCTHVHFTFWIVGTVVGRQVATKFL
jgi:hypothetical protein